MRGERRRLGAICGENTRTGTETAPGKLSGAASSTRGTAPSNRDSPLCRGQPPPHKGQPPPRGQPPPHRGQPSSHGANPATRGQPLPLGTPPSAKASLLPMRTFLPSPSKKFLSSRKRPQGRPAQHHTVRPSYVGVCGISRLFRGSSLGPDTGFALPASFFPTYVAPLYGTYSYPLMIHCSLLREA
jgi:hypothetical protein